MDFIQTTLVGFIQGLTEFLPVSSSAHIVLAHAIYKLVAGIAVDTVTEEEIFFDIIIHLGTLCAIFIYIKDEIFDLTKALFNAIKTRDFSSYEAKIGLYIMLGTVITGVIALPLKKITENILELPHIVGLLLVITGFVLFFSEKIAEKFSKDTVKLDAKRSIIIAISQGLAVFPGFSRSGLTIATGLACGLTRVKSAKYSFLLSFPVILGASCAYPIMEIDMSEAAVFNWYAIICGFFVAGIVGYFCIKYFIIFLAKYSLNCFAYYCWLIGAIMFVCFNPFFKIFS